MQESMSTIGVGVFRIFAYTTSSVLRIATTLEAFGSAFCASPASAKSEAAAMPLFSETSKLTPKSMTNVECFSYWSDPRLISLRSESQGSEPPKHTNCRRRLAVV